MVDRLNLFKDEAIRKVMHHEELYFCVRDVVQALTNTKNVKGYIKDMRRSNKTLNESWEDLVVFLDLAEADGTLRKLNCANLRSLVTIIKAIPAEKAKAYARFLGVG